MNENQQELIEDLRARRYWLHEKFYEIEKYIKTIEETQNSMINNGLEEELLYLLPQETLETIKKNVNESRGLIKKLRKRSQEGF